MYHRFPFNRKSAITNIPTVKPGDHVEPGQLLARSNFTDDQGVASMSVNARIGIVPYKGHSMDDAIVVSESFAKRLTSEQTYTEGLELDDNTKLGKKHFQSLFPQEFTKDQLEKLDDQGIAPRGTVLEKGDPYVLATQPRMITSQEGTLGKLSRSMSNMRRPAALVWDHEEPGEVLASVNTGKGVKVLVRTEAPLKNSDKLVLRHGQKAIASKILPDEHMPRTKDGKPLEVLLNPLSIPSRVANGLVFDILLGKVAKHRGEPLKLPSYLEKGSSWEQFVRKSLEDEGLTDKEEVFDPKDGRSLENPITVGYAPVLKLHHLGASKVSMRGQASYDQENQPLKGGSDSAQAKRLSTLEQSALMSAGAYATLREASTVRGTKSDDFWRAIRQGQTPREPGEPFVWNKFRALLEGSGMTARDVGGGNLRLGPMTDKELDSRKPLEIQNGELVDPSTMEPVAGGLFDPVLVGGARWGKIPLPEPVPNPAFEKQIAQLLGIRQKDVRRIVAGEVNLEDVRK